MKEITRFNDAEEAQIAAGFLRSQGVTVHVADEKTLGAMPHLSIGSGGYRLMAEERDANIAVRLLADIDHDSASEEANPRLQNGTCEVCGAQNMHSVIPAGLFALLRRIFSKGEPSEILLCRKCGHKQGVPTP